MNRMDVRRRFSLLEEIYSIYESFIGGFEVACKPGCDTCCTSDVTVTTIEAYRVLKSIRNEDLSLPETLRSGTEKNRFRPAVTTNELAYRCLNDLEIPSESHSVSTEKCPLLSNGLCSVYEDRPFGCRCFVSRQNCAKNREADVDPFILTANTLFLQFIEHIDQPGFFGNFTDMLLLLASPSHLQSYLNHCVGQTPHRLLSNQSVPALMIPPEHRDRIDPVLTALQQLRR